MHFKDTVVFITGAGRGIGREIAKAFARHEAQVIVSDIVEGEAPTTVDEIMKLGGRAQFMKVDVADSGNAQEAVKAIIGAYGKIGILINNAGITRDTFLLRMKDEDWERVMDVNLKGVFSITKAVLPFMIKEKYGRIINISSVVGLMGNLGQTNYAASKAGLIGFTKALAREVASRGITVNAVAPGYIDTEMTRGLQDAVKERLIQLIPLGRLGTATDIAGGVLFLASEEASYVTGHVLSINGGMYM